MCHWLASAFPFSFWPFWANRRVTLKDLMEFKQTMDRNRLQAIEELSAIDQELGLGYRAGEEG